jgi:type VI secretion system protein VasJ
VATGPAVVVAAPTATVSAPPTDVSQVATWLSGVGTTVVQTANTVRRAADSTALAYRMTRVGLYSHLVDAPPADATGKTKVPPPQPNVRKQVEAIAANQKWSALIEECESALSQSRFWLDLHRYTAQALAGLGASHAKAREEVVRELATVLKRLPPVATLQFADGTPFADAATQQWITSEVLAGGGGGGAPSAAPGAGAVVVVQQGGGGAGEEAAIVAEAKKMAAAGKAGDAIAMLQAKATSAPSDAGRFRYRLGIGQVCLAANQAALAKGVFEGLEREIVAHGLEQWEPALAAASAEGLVLCYRALAKGGKPIPPEASVLYDRVCRLDPAAALRIGAS